MSIVVALLLGCLAAAVVAKLPHVSDCNFCSVCYLPGESPDAKAPATRLAARRSRHLAADAAVNPAAVNPEEDPSRPASLRASSYRAAQQDIVRKQKLGNCTACTGCTTRLGPMPSRTKLLNRTFAHEPGNTHGFTYLATTNRTANGIAITKIFCLPLSKREPARGGHPVCGPGDVLRNARLLLGLQKLVDECGFNDLVPRVWVDRVDAILPNTTVHGVRTLGYHVYWHAMWMEYLKDYVSLSNVLYKGEPQPLFPVPKTALIQDRLNKTKVVRAAIFDLLTSQNDRHSQNIMVNEAGDLRLIDNDGALSTANGYDSILLPGTQKFEIIRLSNQFVHKQVMPSEAPQGVADLQVLLDYRCYLPGGKSEIHTDYPPQVKQCLQKIAGMTVPQVQKHYDFMEEQHAKNLHSRATDMLEKGFEWALMYGEPVNPSGKRYRFQPKCCNITWRKFEPNGVCAHRWNLRYELPFGDPNTGGVWTKSATDSGSYDGGTHVMHREWE